jgi:integrase
VVDQALSMTYIVQRQDRFYVVANDGLDPLTGKERRRWHPVGHDRGEADALAARLDRERTSAPPKVGGPTTVSQFLRQTWLPQKRRQVRPTTAYRYAWFVDRYIIPAVGDIPLRRLRVDHLDALYAELAASGGRNGTGLAPKTVLEVHMIIRAALDAAGQRQLVERNVASAAHVRLSRANGRSAQAWTSPELARFLTAARAQRMYPALHLAAHTGMRRGEVVGLKWSDLDVTNKRLSVQRTLQCLAGRPVEFGVKTRTSRRCIDLDAGTISQLRRWRQRIQEEWLPAGDGDWMFCNTAGRFSTPNHSASCSIGWSGALRSRASDSMMFAILMPRCSSPPASGSRSSASASATPIPASP